MREVIRGLSPADRLRVLTRTLAEWVDALELAKEDSDGKARDHMDAAHGLGEDMLWELREAFKAAGP